MAKTPTSQKEQTSNKARRPGNISLKKLPPELARSHMKALLLANPNYFGTLAGSDFEPVLNILGDTAYENIGCVGFNPQLNRLEAVVNINQETGYSGDVCSSGSQEFVRFYLSYDDGASWQDQGLTSFTVYDVPGPKPLEYDVTLHIDPPEEICFLENLPKVRAILSWNTPPDPNNPDWPPIWGDVVNTTIQIAGFEIILLEKLLAEAKLDLGEAFKNAIDLTQPIKAAKSKTVTGAELLAHYQGKGVPGHRALFSELKQAAGAQTTAITKSMSFSSAFAGLENIDLGELVENLLNTEGDTSFEQLNCVGLNPNDDQLVGILNVKKANGYSGGPCSAGSQEYVAFWVDWGGGWAYAGTSSVTVHDYNLIPDGGLDYSVFLPIDLTNYRQPCADGPKTARVRAVLSWNYPPSTTDPYAPVTWGNSDETLILIGPGPIVEPGTQIPFLSRLGDISENKIDGSGRITDAHTIQTSAHYVNAPFGGRITIAGLISSAVAGLKYRVMKKPHGAPDASYAPIVNEPLGLTLTIDTFDGVSWTQTDSTFHDLGDGYYPYEDIPSANQFVEAHLMGEWYTTAADDGHAFDLRIDLSIDGDPAHDVHSNVVTALIDNRAPVALLDIDLGMGVECADFDPGVTFQGHYTATDANFGSFSFVIRPPGPANGALPSPSSGLSTFLGGLIADPGVNNQIYTLNTGPMRPCGYSLTLQVWDRTNVNSGFSSNYNEASVGFCLRVPTS